MNKRFLTGCTIGLFIFILLNLLAAHLSSDCGLPAVLGADACADDIVRAGWPLMFMESGGFVPHDDFRMAFLLIDLLVGLGLSVFTGWLFSRYKEVPPK